ncbi:MAG: hypothetical protein ACR2NR_22650 [Solirubrobacteraceae bacterium]
MREAHALKLRNDGEEVLGDPAECRVVVVETVRDRGAVAEDRVVSAERDPVIARTPVVVKLAGAVIDPLTAFQPIAVIRASSSGSVISTWLYTGAM